MAESTTPVVIVSDTVAGKAATLRDRALEHVNLEDADYLAIVPTSNGAELVPVDDEEVVKIGSKNILRSELDSEEAMLNE